VRTNKRKAVSQITRHQRRQAIVRAMASKDPHKPKRCVHSSGMVDIPFTLSKDHHHIAESEHSHDDILGWVHENQANPSVKVGFSDDCNS
jgi:hypothetical protein